MPFYKATAQEKHARTGKWKTGKNAFLAIAVLRRNLKEADDFVQHQLFGSCFWQTGAMCEISREEAKKIWATNKHPATDEEIDALIAELEKTPIQ